MVVSQINDTVDTVQRCWGEREMLSKLRGREDGLMCKVLENSYVAVTFVVSEPTEIFQVRHSKQWNYTQYIVLPYFWTWSMFCVFCQCHCENAVGYSNNNKKVVCLDKSMSRKTQQQTGSFINKAETSWLNMVQLFTHVARLLFDLYLQVCAEKQ